MRQIKTTFSVIAFLVAFLSSLLVSGSTASAAPETSLKKELTVSPTITRLELKAGQSTSGEFTIFNSGEVALDVAVSANPYSVKDENYDGDFENATPRSQVARWITFTQTEYHLEPREQATVNFIINTPKSIPDGSQYAVLLASMSSETTSTNAGSFNTIKRVGTLLYASTNGRTKESGSVKETSVKGWQQAQPVSLVQRISNDGNTDFTVKTTATLTSLFGNKAGSASTAEQPVLPDTTRATTLSFKDKVAPGFYKLHVESQFLNQSQTMDQWILVAPVWFVCLIIVLFLAIIAAIVMLVIRFFGKENRKKMSRMSR